MTDKKIFSVISKINGEERISALFADNLIQAKKQLEDSGLLQNHEVTGIRQATKSDLEHIIKLMYNELYKRTAHCHNGDCNHENR